MRELHMDRSRNMKISTMMKCSFQGCPHLFETDPTGLKDFLWTIGFPLMDCEKILEYSLKAYMLASLESLTFRKWCQNGICIIVQNWSNAQPQPVYLQPPCPHRRAPSWMVEDFVFFLSPHNFSCNMTASRLRCHLGYALELSSLVKPTCPISFSSSLLKLLTVEDSFTSIFESFKVLRISDVISSKTWALNMISKSLNPFFWECSSRIA